MKKVLIAALTLAVLVGAADAYLGQVVGSFMSPAGTLTRGLARSASYLYVLDGNNPGLVYRLNPTTGSVYGYDILPFAGSNRGLGFVYGSFLYVGNDTNDRVYRVNADTNSVVTSWPANHDPFGLDAYCTGDGGQGTTAIYATDSSPSAIYTHEPWSGSITNSVTIAGASDYDCAYDWRNTCLWLGRSNSYVYGYTPSGVVMGSFSAPQPYPSGLAYYGSYLWVSCTSYGYIYRIHCPQGFVGAEPASLGHVKALYR